MTFLTWILLVLVFGWITNTCVLIYMWKKAKTSDDEMACSIATFMALCPYLLSVGLFIAWFGHKYLKFGK